MRDRSPFVKKLHIFSMVVIIHNFFTNKNVFTCCLDRCTMKRGMCGGVSVSWHPMCGVASV